jgi:hypothetical protein
LFEAFLKPGFSETPGYTLILWDIKTGEKIVRFPTPSVTLALAVFARGVFGGWGAGETFILKVGRELICPTPVIATIRYIWELKKHQYFSPLVDCPFCGTRFEPKQTIIDTIHGILRNGSIGSGDSPCLKLPKEAWEEPGLLSACPKCGEAIKFNPFIVGND